MNFGMLESLEKALSGPAGELNQRLDRLAELVQGMTAEQKQTNELLRQIGQKPTRTPVKR